HLREFTKDDNELLGRYFGGKGWPFYNIPNPTNDPNAPLKIPSGANVFAQSPLKDVRSSYGTGDFRNAKYMLSSGGTKPVSVPIGWAGNITDPAGSFIVHLNLVERDRFPLLDKDNIVRGITTPPLPSPVQDGTTLVEIVDLAAGTVRLSKPLIH